MKEQLSKLGARIDKAWPPEQRRKAVAKAKRFGKTAALTVTAVGAAVGADVIALANGVDTPIQGYRWTTDTNLDTHCIYTYIVAAHSVQPGEQNVAMRIVPFIGDPSKPENRGPAQIVDLTGKPVVVSLGIETCFSSEDFFDSGVVIFAANGENTSSEAIYNAEVDE